MSNGISSEYFRQGWQFFSRCYIAQVDKVNTKTGVIDVIFLDGLNTKRDSLEMPKFAFSMQSFGSSWFRMIPQVGDVVYVVFGPHGEARVLLGASMEGMYAEYAKQTVDAPATVPVGDFGSMSPGEWDLRSSGGAYIYGDKYGSLLLSGGPTSQLRFNKRNNDVRGESGLWVHGSQGSYLRLGDVKRTLVTNPFRETDVSLIDPTAVKEFWLHIENPSLGVKTQVVDLQEGTCRNSLGVPYTSFLYTGLPQPLRHRHKIWDLGTTNLSPIPTAAYSNQIDTLGNQEVAYGDATTTVNISGGPLTKLSVSGLTVSSSSTTSTSISAKTTASVSGLVEASITSEALTKIDAPIVSLGDEKISVSNPAVHGTVLEAQLIDLVTALTTVATTLSGLEGGPETPKGAAWTALTSALAPILTILSIPPGSPASLLSDKVFVE